MREGRCPRWQAAAKTALAAAVVITTMWIMLVSAVAYGSQRGSNGFKSCGTKTLYGKTLQIRVRGQMRSCERVQRIIRGKCRIQKKRWSCFSFRTPDPPLVWFRAKELFDRRWSTVVEAERYPCSEAALTSEDWNGPSRRFPTRKQILSDDLIRCELLDGMTISQVEQLLGEPTLSYSSHDHAYRDYDIGPERDSFFQIDPELLSIEFRPDGTFVRASIYQG
jgi:hypothetical protein